MKRYDVLFKGGPLDGKVRNIEFDPPQFAYAADIQDDGPRMAHYMHDDRYICTEGFLIFKYVDGPNS